MTTKQSGIFWDVRMRMDVIPPSFRCKAKHADEKSWLPTLKTQRKHVYILLLLFFFFFPDILPLNISVIA